MTDLSIVLLITVGSCLAVGLVGMLLLRRSASAPVTTLLVLAMLVPVTAVGAAVVVNVQAMFISSHDSRVVLTALATGLVVALGLAITMGRLLVAGSEAVSARLRMLGRETTDVPAGMPAVAAGMPAVPAELAALSHELEATRARLDDSRRREQGLQESRRELVAFMSHDLRTPLAGVRALAEAIEDGVVDDVPAALAQVRASVERMTGLVEDLFELSRLSHQAPRPQAELVSLREVAEDVVGEAYEPARGAGVDVRLDVRGDDRLPVLGAADDLARALSNLVMNAVRHTVSGDAVLVVGGRGDDGRVVLSVLDGCGGIPDDDLPRVFDVGWRGSPDRTPSDGGAGLGLAIARGVVEAHRGSLDVANTEVGCRFDVALPGA